MLDENDDPTCEFGPDTEEWDDAFEAYNNSRMAEGGEFGPESEEWDDAFEDYNNSRMTNG